MRTAILCHVDINCLCCLYFVANSCWGDLDIVCGSTREWICCIFDIVHIME